MNIKIHTFFYGNNYGALLQSFFFKSFLEKECKANVYFNDYQPKKFIYREEIKPILRKNIFNSLLAIKKLIKLRKWKKKYIKIKPSTSFKIITKEENSFSFYGSDEIWNFNNPFFGFDPYFFGKSNSNIKFSYAASFGNGASKEVPGDLHIELKNYFDNFKNISVRDLSSYNFLKKNFNIESEIVLDPIFLVDNDFELINEKKLNTQLDKYCLIYGQYFSKNEIEIITNFSKKNKLKIVSIGYFNKWADKNFIDASPTDFINYFKFADYIFTSMFHGVLFSIKYNKTFWFTIDPYRINKLDHILKTLNISDRLLKTNVSSENKLDYSEINSKIEIQKKNSKEFINKCIKDYLANDK